jgi:hypothetical protein
MTKKNAVKERAKRGRGRPSTGRMQVALKLLPATNKALARAAKLTKTTKSEFADRAILERIAKMRGVTCTSNRQSKARCS